MNIIAKDSTRSNSPRTYQIDDSTHVHHWGPIKMLGSRFMPSSFMIKSKEVVVYIDPVGTEATEKADYIFITHSHPDHLSKADIKRIIKPETVFVCAKNVTSKLRSYKNPIHTIKPGEELGMEDIHCQAIAAYNFKPAFLGFVYAHPKSAENVGFVLTFESGVRIYHAGDSNHVPEMDVIQDIDLALVPIGGRNLTMNAKEAAGYINQLKPKAVVPMHFTLDKAQAMDEFEGKLVDGIIVKRMVE